MRGLANSGAFRSASQVYTIGHMRLPELIKIQCFKNASQLYMLDQVFEMIIMGGLPNCIDWYEYIKLYVIPAH